MNGLYPWLKTEVSLLEPKGLAAMMKLALKIEHREMVCKEAGFVSVYKNRIQYNLPKIKEISNSNTTNIHQGEIHLLER